MTDFNTLLDAPLDQFEAPKPFPPGSYLAVISAPAKINPPPSEDKSGSVVFPVSLQEAMPDVDQEALAEALNGKPLTAQTMDLTFYLSEKAAYRIREFAEQHLGLPGGQSTRELISAAVGIPFVVNLEQRPSQKDPSKVYTNIASTAAVPA